MPSLFTPTRKGTYEDATQDNKEREEPEIHNTYATAITRSERRYQHYTKRFQEAPPRQIY